jgi:hypothetical protein
MTLPAAAGANPSVDQYVESVPTGDGGTSGGGGAKPEGGTLPQRVRDRLQEEGGSDAAQLEAVATSPALGAPAAGKPAPTTRRDDATPRADAPKPSALDAATTAAVDNGGAPIGVLVGGMLALTAIAGAAAFARRRPQQS